MSLLKSSHSRRCDLSVLKRTYAADTEPAHGDIIDFQRDTAFGGNHAGQGEVYQPPAQHGVFRGFGRALKSRCCMRLASCRFDAAKLGIVTALQVEQMSAIVYDGDGYIPVIAPGFSLGCCRNAHGVFQGEHGFAHHDYLPDKAARTCSRMLSTLPTPGIFTYFGALGAPDFAQAV